MTITPRTAGDAPGVDIHDEPGRAWTLPPGPECAGYARGVLNEMLEQAGASRSLIGDAQLMVSELATNAHQHAHDEGPHELWLYRGEVIGEARCAVFDRHLDARLPGYSWTSGDCGRGLNIVHELSDGQWGMLRTWSRCFPRIQGKVVWFMMPVPLLPPVR